MTLFSPLKRFDQPHFTVVTEPSTLHRLAWYRSRGPITHVWVSILTSFSPCYHSSVSKHNRSNEALRAIHAFREGGADVFTGLVEGLGRLERIVEEDGGRRLTIVWPGLSP